MKRTRHCIVCGVEFEARRANHTICSLYCQHRKWKIGAGRMKLIDGRRCKQCGTRFYPSGSGENNKQHCSDSCAAKSARQSRSRFFDKNPQKMLQYHAAARQKHGPDANMKRFRARHPFAPSACQSCGESRVLDIAHKPEFRRNGSHRSAKNTTIDRVWILCPTCHALIDRKGVDPASLGLH